MGNIEIPVNIKINCAVCCKKEDEKTFVKVRIPTLIKWIRDLKTSRELRPNTFNSECLIWELDAIYDYHRQVTSSKYCYPDCNIFQMNGGVSCGDIYCNKNKRVEHSGYQLNGILLPVGTYLKCEKCKKVFSIYESNGWPCCPADSNEMVFVTPDIYSVYGRSIVVRSIPGYLRHKVMKV